MTSPAAARSRTKTSRKWRELEVERPIKFIKKRPERKSNERGLASFFDRIVGMSQIGFAFTPRSNGFSVIGRALYGCIRSTSSVYPDLPLALWVSWFFGIRRGFAGGGRVGKGRRHGWWSYGIQRGVRACKMPVDKERGQGRACKRARDRCWRQRRAKKSSVW